MGWGSNREEITEKLSIWRCNVIFVLLLRRSRYLLFSSVAYRWKCLLKSKDEKLIVCAQFIKSNGTTLEAILYLRETRCVSRDSPNVKIILIAVECS